MTSRSRIQLRKFNSFGQNSLGEIKMNHINKAKQDFFELKRIPVYIYVAQLNKIDEICKKRNKTRRSVFFEAFQIYISLYEERKV